MRHLISRILLLAALACLGAGCASVHREAERIHWARHPVHETRMTNAPAEGYVPCGVWRIRGAQNTLYLAGTSHVAGTNQIPFPSPFYAAYQDSREVYVEADTQSTLTVLRLLPKMLKWVKAHQADLACPKDRTLADYLSPDTLEKLRALYGRDLRRERMTPLLLLVVSQGDALSGQSGENGGVEDVFALAARKDSKPLRELDDKTIGDTVIIVLDEMLVHWKADIARRGADAVVQEEILQGEQAEDSVWRRGDMAAVERLQSEMKKELPSVYEKMLPERNRKWMVKLTAVLQGKRNVMALVGVAHLGGPDGLLHLLREAGYKPEQLYGLDQPAPPSPAR